MAKEDKIPAFKPFIPANQPQPEFTLKAVVLGIILGLLFGAVTVYLGLRAGLTIAPNIPISIIAMAFFSALYKMKLSQKASVLEITTVQTTGAASVAAGVIFTMPALLFLGYTLDLFRIFIVALAGALLGTCYLIPLRRYLIEREHAVLPYPEGVACAEVIKSGSKGGASASRVLIGTLGGFVYKFITSGLQFFKEIPQYMPKWYPGAVVNAEVSPELLGVGYIIGPKTASVMVAGGFVSWVLLLPMIRFFGANLPITVEEGGKFIETTIGQLTDLSVIWKQYIRYIGAGAVVAGGFINLVRAMPTILGSFRDSVKDLNRKKESKQGTDRLSQDLPIVLVFIGVGVAVIITWLLLSFFINPGHTVGNLISAVLIAVFGFFFATVSSRLVGEIGVSSNPTSGMTIATLMTTCMIFLAVGWTGGAYAAVALSVGAVVCICASNAGNVAQSLKTAYLLGGTPRKQELGYIAGAFSSIFVVAVTVLAMNKAYTTRETMASDFRLPQGLVMKSEVMHDNAPHQLYVDPESGDRYFMNIVDSTVYREQPGIGSEKLPAPQARLMATVINGVLNNKLPWALIFMGIALTVAVELCHVRGLPFAVGVYLPLSTSAPIFVGGLIRLLVDKYSKSKSSEESGPGMLYASGLIAGGALAGLLLAVFTGIGAGQVAGKDVMLADRIAIGPKLFGEGFVHSDALGILVFILLCVSVGFFAFVHPKKK